MPGNNRGALRAENERKALALIQEAIRGVRYRMVTIVLTEKFANDVSSDSPAGGSHSMNRIFRVHDPI